MLISLVFWSIWYTIFPQYVHSPATQILFECGLMSVWSTVRWQVLGDKTKISFQNLMQQMLSCSFSLTIVYFSFNKSKIATDSSYHHVQSA